MPDFLLALPPGQAVAAVLLLYVAAPFAGVWIVVEAVRAVRFAVWGR